MILTDNPNQISSKSLNMDGHWKLRSWSASNRNWRMRCHSWQDQGNGVQNSTCLNYRSTPSPLLFIKIFLFILLQAKENTKVRYFGHRHRYYFRLWRPYIPRELGLVCFSLFLLSQSTCLIPKVNIIACLLKNKIIKETLIRF